MGRKKIQITRIADERNRQITFSKRKAGLLKKAYELSILCDVEIAVIMITNHSKLYQYASSNMNSILIRYTEFKDPDESKTNADILDELNRRDKCGNESGDEGTDSQPMPLSPSSHFQPLEEFEQVLRNDIPHHEGPDISISHHNPAPIISLTATNNQIPLAMPVSVPVAGNSPLFKKAPHLGSAGSSLSSPNTPLSQMSPFSDGTMPPPTTTPTRLQTIRSHALKLHLPGKGNRNYMPLHTSPGSGDDKGGTNSPSTRPQLTVVIPGQKGFVPTSVGSPPAMNMDSPPPPVAKVMAPPTKNMAPPSNPAHTQVISHSGSLTTPIMSLTTPSLISSLPQGMNSDGPLGSAGDVGSASALVAFPVNIQPGSNATPGSNIIIQAQNMGQPFLLTPTPNQSGSASLVTPPILAGSSSPSSLRDLEQLKLQYDRIYQQISQTLQHHNLQTSSIEEEPSITDATGNADNGVVAGGTGDGGEGGQFRKRGQDEAGTLDDDGMPNSKRPNLTS